MAQLMPLPLSFSVKFRLILPFWYRLTQLVLERGCLNVCVCMYTFLYSSFVYLNQDCDTVNECLHLGCCLCALVISAALQQTQFVRSNPISFRCC